MNENPTVRCAKHGEEFRKTHVEQGNDGTQLLLTQYWSAGCGCEVEIMLALPYPGKTN